MYVNLHDTLNWLQFGWLVILTYQLCMYVGANVDLHNLNPRAFAKLLCNYKVCNWIGTFCCNYFYIGYQYTSRVHEYCSVTKLRRVLFECVWISTFHESFCKHFRYVFFKFICHKASWVFWNICFSYELSISCLYPFNTRNIRCNIFSNTKLIRLGLKTRFSRSTCVLLVKLRDVLFQ